MSSYYVDPSNWLTAARKADELRQSDCQSDSCFTLLPNGKYVVSDSPAELMVENSTIEYPPRTLQELAMECLNAQDGVNIVALAKAFGRAMKELKDRLRIRGGEFDSPAMNKHPITHLWCRKLNSMAIYGNTPEDKLNMQAHDDVFRMAHPHTTIVSVD